MIDGRTSGVVKARLPARQTDRVIPRRRSGWLGCTESATRG